jgi:stearoyl-CoA desaturase (delta-9 desaturase)
MLASLYGLIGPLSLWSYIAITFVLVQLMLLGVTLYLHRDQSHGGLVLHPALRHFFRFWLWFSSGTVTREWVAVHRRHHAFADRRGDPHSPVVFGLDRVLWRGYELYVDAATNARIVENYGRGTPDDWLERRLYSRFPKLGIALFILCQVVLFGVPAITMLAVQLVAQPFLAAGVINGLGHALGYRSFEIPNAATNIVPWGVLIAGEELHNNHHAFPASPRFDVQRWEIDIGWLWICLFRALGLAEVGRLTPRPTILRERGPIDAATVRVLFTNRMHVLRDYRRQVMRPLFRELSKQDHGARRALRMPYLLIRDPTLSDERLHQDLLGLAARHEPLRVVLGFRDRLLRLWNGTSSSHASALRQLRELCLYGERSGIPVLQKFVERISSYAPARRRPADLGAWRGGSKP